MMQEQSRAILDLRGIIIQCYKQPGCRDTMRNAEGEMIPTARYAIQNFMDRFLIPILERFAPINVIGVLEGSNHNARRRNIWASYKTGKKSYEDDDVMMKQMDEALLQAQKLLQGLGCILVKAPNCEADDVIALLVEKLKGGKIIYTVDSDLLALMRPEVAFCIKGEMKSDFKGHDLNEVFPGIVTLYKSMVGDTSDFIKGVKGIGEGTFDKFVQSYGYEGMEGLFEALELGDFEQVREWAESYDDKKLMSLYEQREQWRLSYMLCKLHPEWPESTWGGKRGSLQWNKRLPSRERVAGVLDTLGLEDMLDSFTHLFPTFTLVTTENEKKLRPQIIRGIKDSQFVPFDYETYDRLKHPGYNLAHKKGNYVDLLNSVVTGASFCYGENFQHNVYFSTAHRDTKNLPQPYIGEFIEALHEDFEPNFVAHNASFEVTVTLLNYGIQLTEVQDTVIGSSYVNENEEDRLKALARHVLNYDQTTYDQVVPKGKDMRDVSGQEVMKYGCDDSFVTAHLMVLFRIVMECEGTWDFFEINEWTFDTMLLPGFIAGIPIDFDRLAEISAEDDIVYIEAEKKVRELLAEHCAEVNEEGFETLWEDYSQFVRADLTLRRDKALKKNEDGITTRGGNPFKVISLEDIEKRVEEARDKTYAACRYIGQEQSDIDFNKSGINKIAKAIGLPSLPSLAPDRIGMYVEGISTQFAENEPSELQEQFIVALGACMEELEDVIKGRAESTEATEAFEQVMNSAIASESKLWNGDPLNVGSSIQMAQLFIGKMGLPILVLNPAKEKQKVTARSYFDLEGAPSTNEISIRTWMAEMDKEEWEFQVLENILKMKRVRQRRSLYYKPYPLWRSPEDGRIHPQFKNCGTITRRPSGRSPNILQVSKTKDDGRLRSCFLPQDEDSVIVSIDFVQQELVILAALSQDKNLLSCYVGDNRRDVHSMTGTTIMNMLGKKERKPEIVYDDFVVQADQKGSEAFNIRKKYAKTTNFLIVYGGSAVGLSRKTIVPRAMAEQFVDGFHATYPGVAKFQEKTIKFAKKHGYVQTFFGNRKHCIGLFDKNANIVNMWERQAVNFLIQSGAADIAKKVSREFVMRDYATKYECIPYAFIYDEVLASVKKKHVAAYVEAMADIMELELPGGVRLRTSVSIGLNWGEQIELGERPTAEAVNDALAELEAA